MSIWNFISQSALGDKGWFVQNWFFWMILGTYLIIPIINKWTRLASFKEVEYFLILWMITCLFTFTLNMKFPVDLRYFVGSIGFVVLGYYLRHTDRKIFNDIRYAFLIFVVSAAVMMIIGYLFSTDAKFFALPRYSILNCIEVTGIFLIFKNFHQLNINIGFFNNPDGIFRKFIFEIAKYSYGIYLYHMFFLNILAFHLKYAMGYTSLYITVTILTLLISMFVLAGLNRIPYVNQVIGAK